MQRQKKVVKSAQGSVARQVQSVQDALTVANIEPPDHVTLVPGEMIFFYEIIEEFARNDWTNHQLSLAAFLAREMYSLEKQQRMYRKEGAVFENDKGTLTINPRRQVISMHANSILNFRRSLALHARSISNTFDRAKKMSNNRNLDALPDMYSGDDNENELLLPRMNN